MSTHRLASFLMTLTAALMLFSSTGFAAAAPEEAPAHAELDEHGFAPMDLDGLVRAETNHFRAWAVPEARVGMENILKGAEAHRTRIYDALGLQENAPIRVLFMPDLNDYFARRGTAPRAPEWAIGLAIPRESTVIIKWGRGGGGQWVSLEPTFVHELAHMALDRAVGEFHTHIDGDMTRAVTQKGRRIPRWLHEGFAIQQAGEWNLERGTVLMQAGLRGRIIPLTSLHHGFPAEGFDVELAYAESYQFVSHLMDKHGDDALVPLIREMSQGREFNDAFARAYGVGFESEESRWRDNLNVAYTWIPLLTGSSAIWFLGGLIFVMAWRRKRIERKERLAAMADLEPISVRPQVPLPGLGLTAEHARSGNVRVLYDGTALPRDSWGDDLDWASQPPPSDLSDDIELPRTDDGFTIH